MINSETHMNIGIDFDDTITHNPKFFKKLTSNLSKGRNKIYIISSYTKVDAPIAERIFAEKSRKLKKWGITYAVLKLVKEPIPRNKAIACKNYKIEFIIDNAVENLNEINKTAKGTVCLQYIGI